MQEMKSGPKWDTKRKRSGKKVDRSKIGYELIVLILIIIAIIYFIFNGSGVENPGFE